MLSLASAVTRTPLCSQHVSWSWSQTTDQCGEKARPNVCPPPFIFISSLVQFAAAPPTSSHVLLFVTVAVVYQHAVVNTLRRRRLVISDECCFSTFYVVQFCVLYTPHSIVTVDVSMLTYLCVFLVVGRSQMAVLTH